MDRPKLGEGVGCFIVSTKDMMKLKTNELLLELSDLLSLHRHAGVTSV
jgi:hypothetical protein